MPRDGGVVKAAIDEGLCLHVVGTAVVLNDGQRQSRVGNDVFGVLSDKADVNHRPALIVNAVRRDGTKRVTRHVNGYRRQHTETLLQE